MDNELTSNSISDFSGWADATIFISAKAKILMANCDSLGAKRRNMEVAVLASSANTHMVTFHGDILASVQKIKSDESRIVMLFANGGHNLELAELATRTMSLNLSSMDSQK